MGNLNKDQIEAVEAIDIPTVVLASPGSGKTSVVAAKVVHILNSDKTAYVCCTTFSKEGAVEMESRIHKNLPVELHSRLVVSTLHSLCYQQLKSKYGRPVIVREFEVPHIINKIKQELQLSIDPSDLRSIIDKIPTMPDLTQVDRKYKDAYNRYREILHNDNKTDFNSLLVDAVNLLETGELTPNSYTHLICDEAQDADILMKRWLDVHVSKGAIPTVMLDDDQTLYSFRNSMGVKIARSSQKDYGARIIRLGINYRSNEEILIPSKKLINCNKDREDKDLVSHKGKGGSYTLHTVLDQYRMVEKLSELIGPKPDDWYILCRTNTDLLIISSFLTTNDIPHHFATGKSIFDQKSTENLLCLLGYCDNPTNLTSEILLRKFGVNDDGMKAIRSHYNSYLDVFFEIDELSPGLVTIENTIKIKEFKSKSTIWLQQIRAGRTKSAVKQITRFAFKLETNLSNQEVIEMAGDLIATKFKGSLGKRLDTISNKKKDNNSDGAKLMTAHASKGLEKKNVLIWNCCEGSFPAEADLGLTKEEGLAHIEEERRILFVAMTRAENNLHLVFQRIREGVRKNTTYKPSPFLKDLGFSTDELIKSIELHSEKERSNKTGVNICL